MNKKSPAGRRGVKNPFLTGLIVVLPTLITIFILVIAFRFLNNNIAEPIGLGVLHLLALISGADLSAWETSAWVVAFIGFPLAIIIIFLLGYAMATFIGRNIIKTFEDWVLKRFPIISTIYPYAKQFIDLLFADDKKTAFKMVVAVQYPRTGLYSLGFVTSDGMQSINSSVGKDCVSIFMPSSPTPFTGYTLFVPKDDIIPLKLSVDEAIRIVVSGGILIPPEQLVKLKK